MQPGDLLVQVALLLEVGGRAGLRPGSLKRGRRVAGHLEEVAADGVEAAIGVDPGVGFKALEQFEAGSGPATMLTATAWLSATTGLSSRRSRTP